MTKALLAALSLAVALGASPAFAAGQCRDAKGKFIKCPPPATASVKCKDAKGKFAKCGAPGAKPVG